MLFIATFAKAAVILQYHHVSELTPSSTSVSPQLFEEHLSYLEKNNYQIWPLLRLVNHLKNDQPIPDSVVVITFDDAYQSIYENAYPLLKKRNWPFTVFVATNSIDKNSELFMSWRQLKEISKNNASIANHTLDHTHLIRRKKNESLDQWRKRITNKIVIAENIIEREIGTSIRMLAFPYGEFIQPLKSLVAELGYVSFGQQSGAVGHTHDLSALPRFPMTNTFGELSQFKTKVKSLPLFPLLIEPSENLVDHQGLLSKGLSIKFPILEININRFNCFLSDFGKINTKVTKLKDTFNVIIDEPIKLPSGRSRLNCTAPTTNTKRNERFYWFSHTWIKKLENDNWYSEN